MSSLIKICKILVLKSKNMCKRMLLVNENVLFVVVINGVTERREMIQRSVLKAKALNNGCFYGPREIG